MTVYNEPVGSREPEELDVEALLKGIYHFADAPEVSGNGAAPAGADPRVRRGLPVDPRRSRCSPTTGALPRTCGR